MDFFYIHPLSFVAFAFILLVPSRIGEEPLVQLPVPANVVAPKATEPRLRAHPPARQNLPLNSVPALDRQAFLTSFSRQAGEALVPCVKNAFGTHGALGLIARLHKNGDLTAIRLLASRTATPECLVESIHQMNFAEPARTLGQADAEVAWTFEW